MEGWEAGRGGRWGCCREFAKLGGDQDPWASLGSRVNRDACLKGLHPDSLLIIGTGPRWSVLGRRATSW